MIFPAPKIPRNQNYFRTLSEVLPSFVLTNFLNGTGPQMDYFDVRISQFALDHMVVTMGPTSTRQDEQQVVDILETHAPLANLKQSEFAGEIRKHKPN